MIAMLMTTSYTRPIRTSVDDDHRRLRAMRSIAADAASAAIGGAHLCSARNSSARSP